MLSLDLLVQHQFHLNAYTKSNETLNGGAILSKICNVVEKYDVGVYNSKNINESRKSYASASVISESGRGCDEMNR